MESYIVERGTWATLDVGVGSRGNGPLAAMDSKGILWLMFGSAYRNGTMNLFNVWNYNPKTDQYRYVWGNNETARTDPRDPGALRVPSSSNHPGGIDYGGITIDKNDNIWITSSNYEGELWMFNTTSMMFVRMHGLDSETSQPSVGAKPGQPGEDVWPGYIEGQCMVTDTKNNLWILSGYNTNEFTSGVWHFNTTSLLWTFVHGNIENPGLGNNATYFGGSWMSGCFIDVNDKVWLYGGWGPNESAYDDYGSIWTFDTRTKRVWELEWGPDTYMARPRSVSSDYHPDNHPGAGEGMVFVDRLDGTLMLAATASYDTSGDWGRSDQVWLYNKSLKQWKLVQGDINAVEASLTNAFVNYRQPGSRYPGSVYPARSNGINFSGDIYVIGGGPNYFLPKPNARNDIWLIPNDQCSSPTANKCDANADCIEAMIGYSCVCKQGYIGDGFMCDVRATPIAPRTPAATPIKKSVSRGASTVIPSVFFILLVVANICI